MVNKINTEEAATEAKKTTKKAAPKTKKIILNYVQSLVEKKYKK